MADNLPVNPQHKQQADDQRHTLGQREGPPDPGQAADFGKQVGHRQQHTELAKQRDRKTII